MFEQPAEHDYNILYGFQFETKWQQYHDTRVKRWRGLYNKNFLYLEGDAVYTTEGEGFVATLETERDEPGAEGAQSDWSALVPLNLTGYTIKLICGNAFELEIANPNENAVKGLVVVSIEPSIFANALSSEHYHVKFINPLSIPSCPLRGTMLFRYP